MCKALTLIPTTKQKQKISLSDVIAQKRQSCDAHIPYSRWRNGIFRRKDIWLGVIGKASPSSRHVGAASSDRPYFTACKHGNGLFFPTKSPASVSELSTAWLNFQGWKSSVMTAIPKNLRESNYRLRKGTMCHVLPKPTSIPPFFISWINVPVWFCVGLCSKESNGD